MNFILHISSKCGQGGRGTKNLKTLRMSLMDAPPEKCAEFPSLLFQERGGGMRRYLSSIFQSRRRTDRSVDERGGGNRK